MEGAGAPTDPPAPHPAVAPVSFLLGKWRGEGEGTFPTISPFRYGEELLFSHHPSKPVISYTQRTWKAASGEPMHAESGYWRPRPDGSVEVVIAQSTGLAEVQKGTYDAEKKTVTLQSEHVGNASKVLLIGELCRNMPMIIYGGEADHVSFSGGGWGALVRRSDGNGGNQSAATPERPSQEDLSSPSLPDSTASAAAPESPSAAVF